MRTITSLLTLISTYAWTERSLVFLQLKKLGVMPPEQPLPPKCYRIYQIMWANNGDTISKQYAGTAALKVLFYTRSHMNQRFLKTTVVKCVIFC